MMAVIADELLHSAPSRLSASRPLGGPRRDLEELLPDEDEHVAGRHAREAFQHDIDQVLHREGGGKGHDEQQGGEEGEKPEEGQFAGQAETVVLIDGTARAREDRAPSNDEPAAVRIVSNRLIVPRTTPRRVFTSEQPDVGPAL